MLASRRALPAAVGFAFAALVFLQVPGIDGPAYWRWNWQQYPDLLLVTLAFGLAATPSFIEQWFRERLSTAAAVTLLCISAAGLVSVSAAFHPGFTLVRWVEAVETQPFVTGYLSAAEDVTAARADPDWLRHYERSLRGFPGHVATKPGGLVAGHVVLVRWFGSAATPLIIGGFVAFFVVVMPAAAWWLMNVTGAASAAGREAAAVLAVAPSLILFFPLPDVAFPLLTIVAAGAWWRALEGSATGAVIASLALFVASMLSFALFPIGLLLLLMWLERVIERRSARGLLRAAGVGAAVFAGAHVALWLVSGYNSIAVFRSASAIQTAMLQMLSRPYPKSIPFDLLDFCLGAGWVAIIAAILWLPRRSDTPLRLRRLALLGLAMPVIVAVSGQVQAETARVWACLIPGVAIAASLETSKWPRGARMATHVARIVVLIALYANLSVIDVSTS